MVERKSPEKKTEKCAIKGCTNEYERSVAKDLVEEAGMEVDEDQKKGYLCKEHYKEYKKRSKNERKIGTLGH
ncbi:MAG: hypothetical protein LLG16_04645 [Euryarchaeota archaeon]|nr:hypothetical protein [Euryarchaeota archaeon]